MANTDPSNKSRPRKHGAGWPDVLIRFMDLISESFNKGTAYVLVIFCVLTIFLVSAIRLPRSDLGDVWVAIIEGAGSILGFTIIIILNNLIWYFVHKNNKRIYRNEIDRLCDERKGIVHSEIKVPILKHTSSDDAEDNGVLLVPRLNSGDANDDK